MIYNICLCCNLHAKSAIRKNEKRKGEKRRKNEKKKMKKTILNSV